MNNNPVLYNDSKGDEGEISSGGGSGDGSSDCCLVDAVKAVMNMESIMMQSQLHSFGQGVRNILVSGAGVETGFLSNATFGAVPSGPIFSSGYTSDDFSMHNGGAQASGLLSMLFDGGDFANTFGSQLAPVNDAPIGINTFEPTLPSARVDASGGKGPNDAGQAGMDRTGLPQNTVRIPSSSGKRDYRVPDYLSDTRIVESKNVDKLHYSSQIKDYLNYAQQNGLKFTLFVRDQNTKLTAPLKEQISKGNILLDFLYK
jgi:hypothetical protein